MKFLSEYGKWCVCVWGDESQSNTSCMVKPQTSDFENLLRNIIMHESHSETRGRGVTDAGTGEMVHVKDHLMI